MYGKERTKVREVCQDGGVIMEIQEMERAVISSR